MDRKEQIKVLEEQNAFERERLAFLQELSGALETLNQLVRYAQHLPDCFVTQWRGHISEEAVRVCGCSCGLDEVVTKIHGWVSARGCDGRGEDRAGV